MKVQDVLIKDVKVVENSRININETNLNELMQSIKDHGIQQPIGVGKDNGKYKLIFGNRRLIACERLGHKTIPAKVYDSIEMKQLLLLNITENLQRKDPSFIEFGRAIDKLLKLGMEEKDVAVRLGIDLLKVRQIMEAYSSLPQKHKDKVVFAGKGQTTKGKIAVGEAVAIVKLKKEFGLNDKHIDEVVAMLREGKLNKEDLKNLSILLRSGISFKDAYEKLHDYYIYPVMVVLNRMEISKAMSKEGITSASLLLRRIIYGKAPTLKQPDFIKV